MNEPALFQAAVVAGGGAVGSLLAQTLVGAGVPSVTVVDVRQPAVVSPGTRALVDDIVRPSEATKRAIAAADLVIVATPEDVAIEALPALRSCLRREALLVETLSVKTGFAAALGESPWTGEVLGINPMFAPSLGFEGRAVVAVAHRPGPLGPAFQGLLRGQGATIEALDAKAHDQLCASLQAATHAAILVLGLSLRQQGYSVAAAEAVMPPPHRAMLALLARVLSADPEVYRDIQVSNPHAAAARNALADAMQEFEAVIRSGDRQRFHDMLGDLKALFDGRGAQYERRCVQMFLNL